VTVGLDNVGKVFCQDGDTFKEFARSLIHGYTVFNVGAVDVDLYAFAADEKKVRLLRPTQCFARIVTGLALRGIALPFTSMVQPLRLDNKIIQNADDVEAFFAPLVTSNFMKEHVPDAHEMWLRRWPEVPSLWGHQREPRRIRSRLIPTKRTAATASSVDSSDILANPLATGSENLFPHQARFTEPDTPQHRLAVVRDRDSCPGYFGQFATPEHETCRCTLRRCRPEEDGEPSPADDRSAASSRCRSSPSNAQARNGVPKDHQPNE
jgi:hypothetical protein